MSKLWLLYSIFLVGIIFLLIPDKTEPRDWFLFSDMKLYPATYIYFIVEKMTAIIFCYFIVIETKTYHEAIRIFFLLVVADLADFLLTYGSVWFSIGNFPVTFNIIKVGVFGLVILNEIWKKYNQ